MEMNSRNIALITIAIMLAVMAFSAINIWPKIKQEKLFTMKEAALEKIVSLQIEKGETYAYLFTSGNESTTLHYAMVQKSGCVEIVVSEIKNNGTACLKKDGTDASGSNLTLRDSFAYLFKPWMLAVKPGWTWNAGIYTNITSEAKIGGFSFYEAGETVYKGREAFIVKQKEDGSKAGIILIIDKEKRILLKEEGPDYSVEIISGPFPLIQQAG
jgi:hypothetical protein